MHDADPLKHAALVSAVRELAEHGAVTHMTDGHNPEVLDADGAVNRLEALQRDSRVLIEIGIDIGGDRSCIEIRGFVARFAEQAGERGVTSASTNKYFAAMTAISTPRQLGCGSAAAAATTWHRPDLAYPSAGPLAEIARVPVAGREAVPWLRSRLT